MIGKKCNFYVKTMQKFGMVLFGVLWMATFFCGCTRKDEAQMMLLTLDDKEKAENETIIEESHTEIKTAQEDVGDSLSAEGQPEELHNLQEETQPSLFYVHICGAVLNPGVYELPAGSRVCDVVEQAGGFAGDAAEDYVNQAQVVPDAAKIVIPTLQEVEAMKENDSETSQYGILVQESEESGIHSKSNEFSASVENGLVNLNTASKADLCTLPGIGEVKADAIINYRKQIGSFTSKEQIMEIEGIKDGLYSKIQDKIYVE